jgi:hypothetical protein
MDNRRESRKVPAMRCNKPRLVCPATIESAEHASDDARAKDLPDSICPEDFGIAGQLRGSPLSVNVKEFSLTKVFGS